MNILSLLDVLEDELENGRVVPFTHRALISKEKCLDIIRDIRLNLPEEIKQAEWIKKERQRILLEAQKEAETIVKEAELQIKVLVDQHEITQRAYQHSREIIENAQNNAKEIRVGAKEYADGLLEEIERYIEEQLDLVKGNRHELNSGKK